MFNGKEIGSIFKWLGLGIVGGFFVDVFLFAYEFCAEMVNCFGGCVGSGGRMSEPKPTTYLYSIIVCACIGLIIGLFIAIGDRSERVDKENAQKFTQNYNLLYKEVNIVLDKSRTSTKKAHDLISSVSYKSDSVRTVIPDCINTVSASQKGLEYFLNTFKKESTFIDNLSMDIKEVVVENDRPSSDDKSYNSGVSCKYCGSTLVSYDSDKKIYHCDTCDGNFRNDSDKERKVCLFCDCVDDFSYDAASGEYRCKRCGMVYNG